MITISEFKKLGIVSVLDANNVHELEDIFVSISDAIFKNKSKYAKTMWSNGNGTGGKLVVDLSLDAPVTIKFESEALVTKK